MARAKGMGTVFDVVKVRGLRKMGELPAGVEGVFTFLFPIVVFLVLPSYDVYWGWAVCVLYACGYVIGIKITELIDEYVARKRVIGHLVLTEAGPRLEGCGQALWEESWENIANLKLSVFLHSSMFSVRTCRARFEIKPWYELDVYIVVPWRENPYVMKKSLHDAYNTLRAGRRNGEIQTETPQ